VEIADAMLTRFVVIAAVALVAVGGASLSPADSGLLERFAPQSATTWWAIVQSNLTSRSWVVRTVDSGRHWRDVTPPVKIVVSSAFAGSSAAWIEAATLHQSRQRQPLYRTLDGGRSWRRVGSVPDECRLDFVDLRHGWCIATGGATGSETVNLVRTTDGGATWTSASRTGIFDRHSRPGALPFACDKTIAFTSPTVGWAAQTCAGGSPRLFVTVDGGKRWKALAPVPLPRRLLPPAGVGLSLPVRSGSRIIVSVNVGGLPHGATVIATSLSGGRSWRTQFIPGPLRYWTVDLIDAKHWLLSDGTTLLSTGDAGRRWHRSTATVRMTDVVGGPLGLNFLSPQLGFAIPDGNGGPLWWTQDGGSTWHPIRVTAGPFAIPR
jgi:photosystem II stability/assembly factor-like uncharacterized protein